MAPPGFTSKKTTTSKSSSTSGGPPGTSSGKSGQDILKDLKKPPFLGGYLCLKT